MTCRVVIAGGGTAGHVLPAIAIAESLIDLGLEKSDIHYTGARRGVETEMIPPTGLKATFFDVVGLQRRPSLRNIRMNAVFFSRLWRARRHALELFSRETPRVVVSVGGYASLPSVLAARKIGIPVVVVSYDRIPGRASRMTSKFAEVTAVAFPDSKLPRAVMTGAPVRRAVRQIDRPTDREAARVRLGISSDCFFVGVIGGSLGSLLLNNAVADYVREFQNDENLAVRHVVGPRFMKDYRSPLSTDPETPAAIKYQVVAYEENMADVYAAVDLLIGRGGAGTIADVATSGTPAILIPWSGAADNHQLANVEYLSTRGAAVLLTEDRIGKELSETIEALRRNAELLRHIGERAYSIGEINRKGSIAELVVRVASKES